MHIVIARDEPKLVVALDAASVAALRCPDGGPVHVRLSMVVWWSTTPLSGGQFRRRRRLRARPRGPSAEPTTKPPAPVASSLALGSLAPSRRRSQTIALLLSRRRRGARRGTSIHGG
jgi:hypothetical protein